MSVYTNAHTRINPFCTFYNFSRTALFPDVSYGQKLITFLYKPSIHDAFGSQGSVFVCGRKNVQRAIGGVD